MALSSKILLITALWAAMLAPTRAVANELSPWDLCNSDMPSETIIGCTALIGSTVLDTAARALAYQRRSDAFILLGAIDSAIEDRVAAFELDPEDIENGKWLSRAIFLKGSRFLELEELDEAITHLEASYKLDPQFLEVQATLALAYERLGNKQVRERKPYKALESYSRAIGKSSMRSASVFLRRAEVYFDLKRYSDASADIAAARNGVARKYAGEEPRPLSNSEVVRAHIISAKILLNSWDFDFDAAFQEATRAVSKDSNNIDALLLRGLIRIKLGNLEGAESDFRVVLFRDRDNEDAKSGLAVVEGRKTVLTKAVQARLKYLGCDPGSVDGKWGPGSKAALNEFRYHTQTGSLSNTPSMEVLSEVESVDGRICKFPFSGIWSCNLGGDVIFFEDQMSTVFDGFRSRFRFTSVSEGRNIGAHVFIENSGVRVQIMPFAVVSGRRVPSNNVIEISSLKNDGTSPNYCRLVKRIDRDRDLTMLIQGNLNFLGYNAGAVDGIEGPQTDSAIRKFQVDNGFAATGRLTKAQIDFMMQIED